MENSLLHIIWNKLPSTLQGTKKLCSIQNHLCEAHYKQQINF